MQPQRRRDRRGGHRENIQTQFSRRFFSAYSASRRLHFMSSRSGAIIFPYMIRRATIHDVPRMQEIINSHAELGKMLFKSYAQVYESLRDFAVYELDGRVVGVTALAIIWADLTEVRSLAVDA